LTSPCRRASDLLVAALLAAAAPAAAQQIEPQPVFEVASPILTVDQEKLFTSSRFGARVQAEIETRSRALAAENRSIEAELSAEEQALTDARPTLTPEEFRSRADAFDARVQRIRTEQDTKARDLGAFRESEQQRFAAELGAVLTDIARARGALVVVDRRALLVSADSIDITEVAVGAMNARLGEGDTP
jgi:Skp family chaperone for outer membrane proteins